MAPKASRRVLSPAETESRGYGLGSRLGEDTPGPAMSAGGTGVVLPCENFVVANVRRSGDLPAVASRSATGRHAFMGMHLAGVGRYRDHRKTQGAEHKNEQGQTGQQPP